MYCRKCGKQISDDAKYCTICGAPTAGGVQTQKQGSNIAVRIVIGIAVWFGGMVLMALIGMALGLGGDGKQVPGLYALAVLFVPAVLAALAAMPDKIGQNKPPKKERPSQPSVKVETPNKPPVKAAPAEPVVQQTSNVYVSIRGYEKRDRPARGRSLNTEIDDFVAVDLETTGLSPTNCEIIEIACIRYRGGVEVDSFGSLIKPTDMSAMTDFIVDLTGITPAMLQDAPSADAVLPQALAFIGQDVVVGHNVGFDINFIYDHCQRLGLGPFTNDYIDTLRLARSRYPELKDHKLKTLVKEFGIAEGVAHRAAGDARQTAQCYQYMTKRPKGKRAAEESADPVPDVCIPSPGLTLSEMETDFVNRVSAILQDHPAFGKIVVQQRSDNYWTMVVGRNDFLRFKYTDRAKWMSLDLPAQLREANMENPVFAAQKNKNQRHWKVSLTGLKDLEDMADYIKAACVDR